MSACLHAKDSSTAPKRFFVEVFIGEFYKSRRILQVVKNFAKKSWRILGKSWRILRKIVKNFTKKKILKILRQILKNFTTNREKNLRKIVKNFTTKREDFYEKAWILRQIMKNFMINSEEFYDKFWRIFNFEFINVKLALPMPWSCVRGVEAHLHAFLASALTEGRWPPLRFGQFTWGTSPTPTLILPPMAFA